MSDTSDYLHLPHQYDPESEAQIEQFLGKKDKPLPGDIEAGKNVFWPLGKSYLKIKLRPNSTLSIKCGQVYRAHHTKIDMSELLKKAASAIQPGGNAAEGLAEYAQTTAPSSAKEAVKEFVLNMAPHAARGQFVGAAAAKFEKILESKALPQPVIDALLSRNDSALSPEHKKLKESVIQKFKDEFVQTRSPALHWTLGFIFPKDQADRFFHVESRIAKLKLVSDSLPAAKEQVVTELNLLRAKIAPGKEAALTEKEVATLEGLLQKLMQHDSEGDPAHDLASFLVYTCSESLKKHASPDLKRMLTLAGPLAKNDTSVGMLKTLAKLSTLESGPIADTLKFVAIGKVDAASSHLKTMQVTTPLSSSQIGQLLDLLKMCCETREVHPLALQLTTFMTNKSALIVPHMTLDLRASLPGFKEARGLEGSERDKVATAIDLLQKATKLPNDPIEILGALAAKMTTRAPVYFRVEMEKIISQGFVSQLDHKRAAEVMSSALAHVLQKEENGESAKLLSQFLLDRPSLHKYIDKNALTTLLQLTTGSLWQGQMQAAKNIKTLASPLQMMKRLSGALTSKNASHISSSIGELVSKVPEGMKNDRATALILTQTLLTLLKHPSPESNRAALQLSTFIARRAALGAHLLRDEVENLLDAAGIGECKELIMNMNPVVTILCLARHMNLGRDKYIAQDIKRLLDVLQGTLLDKNQAETLLEAVTTLLEREEDGTAATLLSSFLLKMPHAKSVITQAALQPLLAYAEKCSKPIENVAPPAGIEKTFTNLTALQAKL